MTDGEVTCLIVAALAAVFGFEVFYPEAFLITITFAVGLALLFAALIAARAVCRVAYRFARTRLSTWHARQKRKPEGGPYR